MKKIRLRGRVVSGLGEGAKYVLLYREAFIRYLGINPYPGTLNIDVGHDASEALAKAKSIAIPPPSPGYGEVHAYRAFFNGLQVYVIKPVITRHSRNIIEVVSSLNLRRKLGLRDGSLVEVVVMA